MPTLQELRESDSEMVEKIERIYAGLGYKNPAGFTFQYEWRLEKLESTVDYVVCGVRTETANLSSDRYREEVYEIELSFEVHFELVKWFSGRDYGGGGRDRATIKLRNVSTGNTLTITDNSSFRLRESVQSLFSEKIREHARDLFTQWEVSDEHNRVRALEARLRSRALNKALAAYGPLQGKGPQPTIQAE